MMLLSQDLAVLLYLLATGLGWAGRKGGASGAAVPWILGVAVVLHAVGFAGYHQVEPPVPLASTPAALSVIAWLIASSYLLSLGFARTRAVSGWVAAAALIFAASGALGLRLTEWGPEAPGGSGAWPHFHVLLAAAGFGVLALSSVAGLGYLLKERTLKSKRGAGAELPSLESLDRLAYLGLALGFPLLTLGVITGFAWVRSQAGPVWTQHAVFSLVAWVIYVVPVASRLVQGRRGHGTARSVVIGFVVLALSYLGARVLELGR
jgi:ABC-type uncharacterized transport system permease subunit